MSNLVFVTGDFCSGSTLLFTLFRKTGVYYCLYEPLHENLPEYIVWRPRPSDYSHHFFVDDYYAEMKGFNRIPELHSPRWGHSGLYLPPDGKADDLYRYLGYLIGTAFGHSPRVMVKENRIAFRLGWIRAKFPHARIVHIYRDKESQWRSNVRRVQEYMRADDVGQAHVAYNGFNMASFCEDLKGTFPQLDATNFSSGFERFCALWDLSFKENQRHADLSVDYRDLTHNFEPTWNRLWGCLRAPAVDTGTLARFVVPPERQREMTRGRSRAWTHAKDVIDRIGLRYARARLRARSALSRRARDARRPLSER